jgi:arabinose-5-phosphate isomerase
MDIIQEVIRVLETEAEGLRAFTERVRQDSARTLEKAVQLLSGTLQQGGKIVVTGLGKSGKIGQKTAATFCSTGSLAVYLHPTEGLHGDLGVVSEKDCVLAFSQTGNTEDILNLLPALRERGVKVIAVAGKAQSRLAQTADLWIDSSIPQEACPHQLAPTTSTTLALAIGDALAVALMQLRGFDEKSFAKNHPGGALGRRLTLKVSDCMHSGSAVGTVTPQTAMEEVVHAATRSPLGGVLVTEGPRLLGLITDGDIRRALSHREKFFDLKAADIMTHQPITVTTDQLATQALSQMENRERPLGVLPVVNAEGHWRGLVRIHDLVQLL